MTPEEKAKRTGRPQQPPLPTIAEAMTKIAQGFAALGGPLGAAQDGQSRQFLAAIISMIDQAVENKKVTAQAKANAAAVSDPAAAEAARTKLVADQAKAAADRAAQVAAQAQALKTAKAEKELADAKAAQASADADAAEAAKVAAAASAVASSAPKSAPAPAGAK